VGAGHAAGQAVATLRAKGYPGTVSLLGDEPYLPYQRPPLSKKFLAGEMPVERLYVKPPGFYEDTEVRLSCRVEKIDIDARQLVDSDAGKHRFDDLIIATGARVRKLDVPGADLAGIHYLRSIADVELLRDGLQEGARLVVIGAGYIGLEVAAVAAGLGVQVTVVEMADRVMSRVTCPQVSGFYEQEHRAHGVQLRLATSLRGFAGNDRVSEVQLEDGSSIAADRVLVGIGVIPNTELAADAGLSVSNGIVVDEQCRTSSPGVYAIGDCTNHPNSILGTRLRLESVHNALEQAKTAASNICGGDASYSQVPWFWSDQYDLKLQIAGISSGYDRIVLRGDPATRSFSCLYLRDGELIAIDAINAPRDFMSSKALIANHEVLSPDMLANTDVLLKDMT